MTLENGGVAERHSPQMPVYSDVVGSPQIEHLGPSYGLIAAQQSLQIGLWP